MRAKTVKELKELLKDLPDDMRLVVSGSDHSYDTAYAGVVRAEIDYSKSGMVKYMWEYYDEGNRSMKTSKVEEVLLVG